MIQPTLVILAAGMGNRYGGLKQIAPVDRYGNLIIDYSIYDAFEAGFSRIVCVIKKEMEKDFHEVIGNRIAKHAQLDIAYQEIDMLPSGYILPEGRKKPWGTGHALLCAKDAIDGPFAVINADDYYGKSTFSIMYDYLKEPHKIGNYAMVGYLLENTLTDHGTVARGICDVGSKGFLSNITERLSIRKHSGGGAFSLDNKEIILPAGTIASMNFWGFDTSFLQALESNFLAFLSNEMNDNILKSEYMLPNIVQYMIDQKKASIKVLKSHDKWFGVTYQQDMPIVCAALEELKKKGVYSEKLWR